MKFIDVHCHLDESLGEPDELFRKLKSAKVEKIIAAGVDVESGLHNRKVSELYDMCYFTAGLHPTELKNYREDDLKIIEEIAADDKCVAIGEIGLDYHYPDTDKTLQRKAFIKQLRLADELNLPVQIHSRDCAEDMYVILKEHAELLKNGALLHCYSHSKELAAELRKLGVKFSFGGTITYSGSKKARRTIAFLDFEDILSETDSPYLPPKSKAGVFPNTPLSIPEITEEIAKLRGVSAEVAAERIWQNAHALFKKL